MATKLRIKSMFKIDCRDGKTLVVGEELLTERVKTALHEAANGYSTQLDLECIINVVDEDLWDSMTENERNLVYAVLANVHEVVIDEVDEYCNNVAKDGIEICWYQGTFIPSGQDLSTLERTMVKLNV